MDDIEEREKERDYYIHESLLYERAYSRISRIITDLMHQRVEENKQAKQNGEEQDGSFGILLDVLGKQKRTFRKRADALWECAEKYSDKFDAGYERLANAVMKHAAEDYEAALCGDGCESEKQLIEKFAKNGAETYTTLDFEEILKKIRNAHPKFTAYVKQHTDDIVKETVIIRANKGDLRDSKYRCPFCGGGLYAIKDRRFAPQIRCTGCGFFEEIKVKRHENKK